MPECRVGFVDFSADGLEGLLEGVLIYLAHHEDLAGLVVLDDGGDEAVGVVLDI